MAELLGVDYGRTTPDGYARVVAIYHNLADKTQEWIDEKVSKGWILIDVPRPEPPEVDAGYQAAMYVHPDTADMRWEVEARPYTMEEVIDDLTEQVRASLKHHHAEWAAGIYYEAGDVFVYERQLYEVVQAHASQMDWLPPFVPALYKVHTPEGEIADWVAPTGAHDAYPLGALVQHNGHVWKSLIDANVWEPGSVGAEGLWELQW